jgi:hypothetical protein
VTVLMVALAGWVALSVVLALVYSVGASAGYRRAHDELSDVVGRQRSLPAAEPRGVPRAQTGTPRHTRSQDNPGELILLRGLTRVAIVGVGVVGVLTSLGAAGAAGVLPPSVDRPVRLVLTTLIGVEFEDADAPRSQPPGETPLGGADAPLRPGASTGNLPPASEGESREPPDDTVPGAERPGAEEPALPEGGKPATAPDPTPGTRPSNDRPTAGTAPEAEPGRGTEGAPGLERAPGRDDAPSGDPGPEAGQDSDPAGPERREQAPGRPADPPGPKERTAEPQAQGTSGGGSRDANAAPVRTTESAEDEATEGD